MIIYLIVQFLLSYYLIKKGGIKDTKKLYIIFDSLIIMCFVFLVYIEYINLEETKEILKIGSIILIIFLGYKVLNNILKNFDKILEGIEKKEKIKEFLLKPVVNKGIYYIIGSLPGNIMYGIYFGVMENGGYFRVGVSSNRDIFFWKYFKGDSRDFFFSINEKIKEKKYNINIIYEVIFRFILIIYLLRKKLLNNSIKEYVGIRMIIYMYLSIFYLYFIFYFHIINFYLLVVLISIEIIFLIFAKQILKGAMKYFEITNEQLFILEAKGIVMKDFINIKEIFLEPLYIETKIKGEINRYIGDKTLSNSVTLNILYKYMIGVNKNTEGYFDVKMNIRSRIHRKKYIDEESIIGDILPRTRYVITSLKYFGYKDEENIYLGMNTSKEYEFINLNKNRNFYLSYYEKAYSKTSLLMLFGVLRINQPYWVKGEYGHLLDESKKKFSSFYKIKNYEEKFLFRIITIYFCKIDKRYFGEVDIFKMFNNSVISYYLEENYSYLFKKKLIENKKNIDIPNKFIGLKDYKLVFKIMGRIQLYEEESVVGNESLQKILMEKENFFNSELLKLEQKIENNPFEIFKFLYNNFYDPFRLGVDLKYYSLENCKKELNFFLNSMLKTKPEVEKLVEFYVEGSVYLQEPGEVEIISTIGDEYDPDYVHSLYAYTLIYKEGFNLDFDDKELKMKIIETDYLNEKYNL